MICMMRLNLTAPLKLSMGIILNNPNHLYPIMGYKSDHVQKDIYMYNKSMVLMILNQKKSINKKMVIALMYFINY